MVKDHYNYEVYYLLIEDEHGLYKKTAFQTQETITEVNFDYKIVYKYEDDPDINVIGFFHTHPYGADYMSDTDCLTMRTWAKCFGRELLCVIDCGSDIKGWWCYPNGHIVEDDSNDFKSVITN